MASWSILEGDCIEQMQAMDEASVDAVVTDPPYGLEFMGKEWDRLDGVQHWNEIGAGKSDHALATGRPSGRRGFDGYGESPRYGRDTQAMQDWHHAWATEALRVLKPGGHLLAFGGTRTYHRLACALEDAGFEIRDCLAWMYSTGFPKSLNLDRLACHCQEGESDGGREAVSQHNVRPVPDADVPSSVSTQGGQGSILFAGVSEQSASELRQARSQPEAPGSKQPVVEGRGDVEASEGELPGRPVREGSAVGVADGSEGRLHHGASASDGGVVRSPVDPNGSGEPSGPRPVEQREGESGTVADEPGSQAGGVWPLCPRCSQPRFPRGLGTALKPAFEPIVLARKPLAARNVAANVTEFGTGALNIDGTRIEGALDGDPNRFAKTDGGSFNAFTKPPVVRAEGRWPANLILDETAAAMLDEQTGERPTPSSYVRGDGNERREGRAYGAGTGVPRISTVNGYGDTGGASRFFYCPKADREERNRGLGHLASEPTRGNYGDGIQDNRPHTPEGYVYEARTRNNHPTVKPVELMQWLCRLVTPPKGVVLDPFTGSGSTGIAALREGFTFIGIERDSGYVEIAKARIEGDAPLFNIQEPA